MFISLRDIQKLFADYPNILTDSGSTHCLSSYCLITGENRPSGFSEHCLYVVDDKELAQEICTDNHTAFLVLTDSLSTTSTLLKHAEKGLPILILETTDTNRICQTLQDYFDDACGMGLFADSLLEILFFEGGIQAMTDKIYPAFQNPIFVFDTDFKLIAATLPPDFIPDEQTAEILANNGFTQTEYEVVNRSSIHKKLKQSEHPVHSSHPVYGYDQLLCAIDTKKDMGHIVLNAVNRPLREVDRQMLYILKKAIDQQMKKDEFIRSNRGFQYEYFLRDLLDGKMAIGKSYQGQMDYTKSDFSGNLYCMVIETARSSNTLNTLHVRSVFEGCFPQTMSLMYQGAIIVLFRPVYDQILSESDLKKIDEICFDLGLFAGIGNCFHDILQLKDYYMQALRSIELGVCHKNNPGLFQYRDYYMNHVAAIFSQKEDFNTFCHPQMKVLIDYDKLHQTDYARILYTWLVRERNMATTAKVLYLHRNTLIYRMKKIHTLIDVDFDDYYERQRMILSYEFYRAL